MEYKEIAKEIEKIRKKMYKSIDKHGLNSEKTRQLSLKIDDLINKYNKLTHMREIPDQEMLEFYDISYKKLKQITKEMGAFPNKAEWNHYAKNNDCLSHISMEYISDLEWKYLKIKVEADINI